MKLSSWSCFINVLFHRPGDSAIDNSFKSFRFLSISTCYLIKYIESNHNDDGFSCGSVSFNAPSEPRAGLDLPNAIAPVRFLYTAVLICIQDQIKFDQALSNFCLFWFYYLF